MPVKKVFDADKLFKSIKEYNYRDAEIYLNLALKKNILTKEIIEYFIAKLKQDRDFETQSARATRESDKLLVATMKKFQTQAEVDGERFKNTKSVKRSTRSSTGSSTRSSTRSSGYNADVNSLNSQEYYNRAKAKLDERHKQILAQAEFNKKMYKVTKQNIDKLRSVLRLLKDYQKKLRYVGKFKFDSVVELPGETLRLLAKNASSPESDFRSLSIN